MDNIKNYIVFLLKEKFSVNMSEKLEHISFFNPKIGLGARDVIILLFCIEEHFGIKFEETTLTNPSFCTLSGLEKEILKLQF